jgi:hypothetical protein
MARKLFESYETFKFISNYPGITEEEKAFMKDINEELTNQYSKIQTTVLNSSFITTLYLATFIIKKRPSRSTAFKIMIFYPLSVLATSILIPFLDFHLSLDHYQSSLHSSPVSSRLPFPPS